VQRICEWSFLAGLSSRPGVSQFAIQQPLAEELARKEPPIHKENQMPRQQYLILGGLGALLVAWWFFRSLDRSLPSSRDVPKSAEPSITKPRAGLAPDCSCLDAV
jgi:hypothetical protein